MQGWAGCFFFEPGKQGFKNGQDIFSLNQEKKDSRMGRIFVFESGKKGFKDVQDILSLNQERKDSRIIRILWKGKFVCTRNSS